jgi:hypothetical protein
MVAAKDDHVVVPGAQFHDAFDYTGSVITPIYEISEEYYFVPLRIPGNIAQKLVDQGGASVNVSHDKGPDWVS